MWVRVWVTQNLPVGDPCLSLSILLHGDTVWSSSPNVGFQLSGDLHALSAVTGILIFGVSNVPMTVLYTVYIRKVEYMHKTYNSH
jgi:hypothetical protein